MKNTSTMHRTRKEEFLFASTTELASLFEKKGDKARGRALAPGRLLSEAALDAREAAIWEQAADILRLSEFEHVARK